MQTKLCPKCGGKGIVAHRHITNKRNSKLCAVCEGKGEIPVVPVATDAAVRAASAQVHKKHGPVFERLVK